MDPWNYFAEKKQHGKCRMRFIAGRRSRAICPKGGLPFLALHCADGSGYAAHPVIFGFTSSYHLQFSRHDFNR